MIKRYLFILILLMIGAAFAVPERVSKKADKVITKFYETDDFTKEIIFISEAANAETTSEFNNENFFKIESDGNFLGYGYIGAARSKTAMFDFLVLFDKEFIITKSKILIYREEYGGEIGSKRWLRQFVGKSSSSSELIYNQDIIPISGATISVRAMTQAINDLLQSVGKLQKLKEL
jgi:Na+-translocating ferredoxin:NAD+ oxidoreductase RnfG subunit